MTKIKRRGIMLVLSSPSGAGKSSIAKSVIEIDKNIIMSISSTTRKKREGEKNGKDYNFISTLNFKNQIKMNFFLEWAKVFGNYYGTPKFWVGKNLSKGRDVIFDIDWQGTQQLADQARDDLVSIFILPPSKTELEKRLKLRAQDTTFEVNKRMSLAGEEISHYMEYDYIIINHNLEESVSKVLTIINCERLKRSRQLGLSNFVKNLRSKM